MNVEHFTLSDAMLQRIATGAGTIGDMDALRDAQYSKRLIQFDLLAELAYKRGRIDTLFHQSLHSLKRLHSAHPATIRSLISSPQVAAWVSTCLRQLAAECDSATGEASTMVSNRNLSMLATISAAAAMLCGEPVPSEIPLIDGNLYLPTLGSILLPPGAQKAKAQLLLLDTNGIDLTLGNSASRTSSSWHPASTIRPWRFIDPDLTIELCMNDPMISADSTPGQSLALGVQHRREVQSWLHQLESAIVLLTKIESEQIPTIAGLVRAVVPSAPAPTSKSSTSHYVHGAVWMTGSRSPATIAEALLHEAQHLKLSALNDLIPLVHESAVQIMSPWSRKHQPPATILHGIYAFLGVVEFQIRLSRETSFDERHQNVTRHHLRKIGEAIRLLDGEQILTCAGCKVLEKATARHQFASAKLRKN